MREIRKSTFREIKASFGRFMAIFAIIALGVGFFAGLKVTREGMTATVKDYLHRYSFYDFRLLSTLGFEQKQVDSLYAELDVEAVEGAVSFDILYRLEDGRQGAVKAHSVTEQVNRLKIMAGRMPRNGSECVVDSNLLGKASIGGKITLSEDNAKEDLEYFAQREYTIVGIVRSPLYLQYERGNTSLGTGRLDGFIYLLPEGFDVDYFTEIYVKFEQNYDLYSEEYDTLIAEKTSVWEELAGEAALERYQDIVDAAKTELEDGRAKLEENRAQGEAELADAARTLAEAEEQLAEGETALADAQLEIAEGELEIWENEEEIRKAKVTISEKEVELDDGEVVIAGKEAELAEARTLVDSNEMTLRSGERELAEGKAQWRSKKETVDAAKMALAEGRKKLQEESAELEKQKEQLKNDLESGAITQEAYDAGIALIEKGQQTIGEYEEQFAATEEQLKEGEKELEDGWQKIAESEAQLNSGWQALAGARQQLTDGQLAIVEGRREIAEGRSALAQARRELTEGEKALADGKKELEEGKKLLREKEEELAAAKQEYADGRKEYEDARKEFDGKIAEAEAEIAKGEEELADLEKPGTYVLGRDTNVGYVCFENDSKIVEGIANIFPVFFFLVAALVCITTMNRMVEEQRTQIGALKALGYGEATIMSKYMIYSGLAAVTGCIFGFFLGTWGFPKVIWFCYGIMYNADPIFYIFSWKLAGISLVVSLLCSIGTTWLSCRVELKQVAAALMRPKTPKAGKRVLLEYIPFLWKRLSFLHKVSLRNIFRYKKRLFMMVLGISGCTALLVTGFGIKDSIADVAAKQFLEVQTYDIGVALKNDADDALREKLDGLMARGIDKYTFVMEKNMDIVTDNGVKSIYLVAGTEEEMAPFLNLHTASGARIAYPAPGEAVISNKLSEDYKIEIGDMITLRDEEMQSFTVRVSGVYENFIYNYVHISEDTWRQLTGEEPERKTVYLNLSETAGSDVIVTDELSSHELAAELMKWKQVSTVTVNSDTMERIGTMMSSLNIIVVVVILCAAGLAFIVLYNLTNINITERIREIATIKVLGFYRRETESYVFRENILLTMLGMLSGLVMGHFLHRFVMNEIRVDLITFHIYVKPISFVYSALLTLIFAWLVNRTMGGKLENISMTESLKSVD